MKKMTENFHAFLLVIVLLFAASNAFANDSKPTVKILNAANKVFALVADDATSTELTIRIFDEKNEILLRDKVTINKVSSKSYNLANLPKGVYQIELEDELFIRKQLVKITKLGLEILEKEERKFFKPYVSSKEQTIFLNYLAIDNPKVEVNILNNDGVEIYSEKIENQKAIHKIFDLSKLRKGNYSVIVNSNENSFTNKVVLK